MTIKIWCEECEGAGNWHHPHLESKLKCEPCQGKGYREVSLDELIKPLCPDYIHPEYYFVEAIKHSDKIKSFLNLELLK